MNTGPMNASGSDRFDAAIRAHHAAALGSLSPRVQAQLAQRRNAALRGQTRADAARPHRLRYAAAGFAALCALALGLRFQPSPSESANAVPPAIAATATAPAGAANTTLLDEDPEFYAWLASADARLVAME